jgi:fumarate reductase flavoprotein subunit
MLEKLDVIRGSTILCGGALTFAGTDMQADKNVQDSNELLKKDLFKVGGNVNDPSRCRRTGQPARHLPVAEEDRRDVQAAHHRQRHERPGSHQVVPPDVIKVLDDTARAKGVKLMKETPVTRLVLDEKSGRIRGVQVEQRGKTRFFGARKGVVLASGGSR